MALEAPAPLLLEVGRIVEEGDHDTLLRRGGRYGLDGRWPGRAGLSVSAASGTPGGSSERVQIDWGSDKKHDTSTLTNCFKGDGYTSTATQSGLPYDSYYLEVTKLGTGCGACTGVADKVSVDTTKAD
ncbi:hypothetical protein GCM10010271_00090 [Streptomyces kurssanovii]|nr:hypothetical protein GCM10010271_00090 [Streptomyces kurssanovii]